MARLNVPSDRGAINFCIAEHNFVGFSNRIDALACDCVLTTLPNHVPSAIRDEKAGPIPVTLSRKRVGKVSRI